VTKDLISDLWDCWITVGLLLLTARAAREMPCELTECCVSPSVIGTLSSSGLNITGM